MFRLLSIIPLSTALLAQQPLSFNRDVRPILSDNCFQCHGPDEKKREADLRLDVREAALKGGDGGPAFVPGSPDTSELVKRITSLDADERMPPRKSNKSLKPEQVAILKRWIADGAKYEGHWAFIAPKTPPIPDIAALVSGRAGLTPETARAFKAEATPVDAFIRARLLENGLAPAPEAPRETLIRRVSLDLTGLPPTAQEVDAFLADKSPDAYGKVVDRLLASPHYGEKMALQWLDFARYADSNGFQTDSSREMWRWRDWVIGAFNRNMRFDQFTVEQLAGDMLPNATQDQIVATGFNRNHRLNGEGGRIAAEWFAETVIDRVETTGMTWMALTLNCCRCHDHKFDPITQREFYGFFAYFNSNDESGVLDSEGGNRGGGNSRPTLPMPTDAQAAEIAKLDVAIREAETRREAAVKELPKLQAAWEQTFRAQLATQQTAWREIVPTAVKSEGGASFTRQADGTWLAGGKNPDHDTYVITAPLPAGEFTGVRIDALPDDSLPEHSLGRFSNGNFVLSDVDAEISAPTLAKPVEVVFTRAAADYEQKGWEVDFIVKDKPKRGKGAKNKKGWAVDGPTKKEPRVAMFVADAPVAIPAGATLTVRLRHDALAGHNMGRFKLSATSFAPSLVKLDGGAVPASLREALNASTRTPKQQAEIEKFFRANSDNPVKRAEAEIAGLKKKRDSADDDVATAMVMKELPKPRDAFILKRGEYDKPGDKVQRVLPAALPPLPPGAPNDRLGFARWLVSGEHPLTARVWVNRAWEKFFGTGLVKTTENFGSQAEWPSHPELLDWLATEFVRLKWDMKAMQRLIVMSAAYRQSSRVTPAILERDPDNRLLARGPRFRLGGEALRDQALAISGLFVPTIGGPSVRPYMPAGVWDETSVYGNLRNYKPDTGDGLWRRSIYTIWKRTAAPPTMLLFDAPNREICTVKRSRTNTPLQALALLNEVTYVEAARHLAELMLREGGNTPEERIAWAFRRATARKPHAEELKILAGGLAARLGRSAQDVESAKKLASIGEAKVDSKLNPQEVAAYTVTANVILNLDEVVTRE